MRDGPVARYPGNPVLTPDAVPYPVSTVHNAGVVRAVSHRPGLAAHLSWGVSNHGRAVYRLGVALHAREDP